MHRLVSSSVLIISAFSLFSFTASATTTTPTAAEFAQCISSLSERARANGITEQTLAKTLATAQQRQRVINLDRNQPEFLSTFEDYYKKRVNAWRIEKGQAMLAKHRDFLRELTRQYGVPGPILMSFWGLETNFGGYKGKIPTIDALSTLACEPRRKSFFTNELLTVLEVIQDNDLDVSTLLGSWAGAMGHTQFMPTTYASYAIDGDGDGKVDLFNSERDALASAANFLHQLGWQAGYRWGREVRLPAGFDFSLADRKYTQPLSFWREQGVTTAYGQPVADIDLPAAIIVPSGYSGPVFAAYPNFNIIMRWNASQSYAIAVGKLAEQIAGSPGLVQDFPDHPPVSIKAAKRLQQQLKDLGFGVKLVDGIIGSGTRAAIRAFQLEHDLVADGFAHPEVFAKLDELSL